MAQSEIQVRRKQTPDTSLPVRVKRKYRRPVIIDWEQFDKLCMFGCTLPEIAAWFDCSEDTIQRAVLKEKEIGFSTYYKSKEAIGLISLRRKQFQLANEGHPGMLIWLGKQKLGQSDQVEQTVTETVSVQVDRDARARRMRETLLAEIA
jgi:hypothetical protein